MIQNALNPMRSLKPALRAILSVCEEGSRDVDDGTRVATETNADAGVVFRPLEVGVNSHARQDGYHEASCGPSPQNEIQDPQHSSGVHLFVTAAGSPSGPRACACCLIPPRTTCALRNFLANQRADETTFTSPFRKIQPPRLRMQVHLLRTLHLRQYLSQSVYEGRSKRNHNSWTKTYRKNED